MKKLLLSILMIIMVLSLTAQNNEKIFRISSVVGDDDDESEYYFYSDENSTNPICRKILDWGDVYVDSLYYNELGLMIKKDCYATYEDEPTVLEYSMLYTYNEKGLKESCTYVLYFEFKGEITLTMDYTYDENDRLVMWESGSDISFVASQKGELIYNEDGLLVELLWYEDDGSGFELIDKDKYYYADNGVLIKTETNLTYDENGEEQLIQYYVYEYDEDYKNCISELIYFYDELIDKYTYTHYEGDEVVYYYEYEEYELDFCPHPTHTNRIKDCSEYVIWEDGTENVCYYSEYNYDEIQFTNIEENLIVPNIYPNPVSDYVNVEAENIEMVELYDIFGRKLCSENVSGSTTIDMSSYSNGVYFLKLYSGGNASVNKIVKKF